MTILFTDIESSTAITLRIGDERAQEMVRLHDQIVRRAIAGRGGMEIKHTGDGIMATFPSAANAVACAVAIQRGLEEHAASHAGTAFRIKIGLNAGEPVSEDADVFGAAVQLAARTCSEAQGGQILATDVVRQLALGKGVGFADAGRAQMKGFTERVQLYEVSAAPGRIAEPEPRALPRWRRPAVLAGTGALLLVIVGASAAVFFTVDAGGGNGARVEFEQYRFGLESESPVEILAGDCAATDIVVRGADSGAQITGDLSGTVVYSFQARLSAADGCSTLTSTETATYAVAGGTLSSRSTTISLHRLGESPLLGSTTEAAVAGIILGDSGTYAGSVGKFVCQATALSRATSGRTLASNSADCIAKLARSSEGLEVILEAVGNTREITTSLGSSGKPDAVRVAAVFRNNTDERLEGVSLRLPEPEGAAIATRTPADDKWSDGARTFALPDLDAGALGSFEFTVRFVEADGDLVTLIPELVVEDQGYLDRSDPIELAVVR